MTTTVHPLHCIITSPHRDMKQLLHDSHRPLFMRGIINEEDYWNKLQLRLISTQMVLIFSVLYHSERHSSCFHLSRSCGLSDDNPNYLSWGAYTLQSYSSQARAAAHVYSVNMGQGSNRKCPADHLGSITCIIPCPYNAHNSGKL